MCRYPSSERVDDGGGEEGRGGEKRRGRGEERRERP